MPGKGTIIHPTLRNRLLEVLDTRSQGQLAALDPKGRLTQAVVSRALRNEPVTVLTIRALERAVEAAEKGREKTPLEEAADLREEKGSCNSATLSEEPPVRPRYSQEQVRRFQELMFQAFLAANGME